MKAGLIKDVAETAVSSATAGATAELSGGDFWQGASFTAALSGADTVGAYARHLSLESSKLDANDPNNQSGGSRNLVEGKSNNFWEEGSDQALGGGRINNVSNDGSGGPDFEPFGGNQGTAPGTFPLIGKYGPGSFADIMVESFAGLHDLLGSDFYDKYGDNHYQPGTFMSHIAGIQAGVDLVITAPFAAAALMSAYHPLLVTFPGIKNEW